MTTLPLSTPFTFDTEFDAAGVVVRPSAFRPAKRAFTPNEVEADSTAPVSLNSVSKP